MTARSADQSSDMMSCAALQRMDSGTQSPRCDARPSWHEPLSGSEGVDIFCSGVSIATSSSEGEIQAYLKPNVSCNNMAWRVLTNSKLS